MSGPTKRKGQATGNNGTSAKVRKQSAPDENIVFSDREMENVLNQLPNGTLLRAVKANTRLLPIASRFIQARYLDRCFEVSNKMEPQSVEFVKIFGVAIRSLRLVYHEDYHRFDPTIEKLISDCCLNAYVIRLVNANRLSMLDLAKPFENVTTVHLETGTICIAFSSVGKWFPKLQTLKLIDVRLPYTEGASFFSHRLCPELRFLQIQNLKSTDNGNGYMEEISYLMKSSPKLGTLLIDRQDNYDELLKTMAEINFDLPNLRLEVDSYSVKAAKTVGTSKIHFKSLKSLNITRVDSPIQISTDQIEKITVRCQSFDENWLTLIKNNQNGVHEIDVFAEKWNDKVASKFVDLIKANRCVRKMNIWVKLSTLQIVDMIENSCSFEEGKFRLSDQQDRQSIKKSLQPKWKCRNYSGEIYHIEKANSRHETSTSTSEGSTSEE